MIYNRTPSQNNADLEEIKDVIKYCIRKLYRRDNVLFTRNNGKGLCERCIVFRFAYYLQDALHDYFVDCDFNSAQVGGREVSRKPIEDYDGQKITGRYIDIIVHKRNFNSTNDYICFEIKKWNNNNNSAFKKDVNNLRILTDRYGYKYGFYLILGKILAKTKWIIFQNGDVYKTKSLVFQGERAT